MTRIYFLIQLQTNTTHGPLPKSVTVCSTPIATMAVAVARSIQRMDPVQWTLWTFLGIARSAAGVAMICGTIR